jgi:hypothetical protein
VQIGRIQVVPNHHRGGNLLGRHGSRRDPQRVPGQFALLEPAIMRNRRRLGVAKPKLLTSRRRRRRSAPISPPC